MSLRRRRHDHKGYEKLKMIKNIVRMGQTKPESIQTSFRQLKEIQTKTDQQQTNPNQARNGHSLYLSMTSKNGEKSICPISSKFI